MEKKERKREKKGEKEREKREMERKEGKREKRYSVQGQLLSIYIQFSTRKK